jgi:hypothetical protein
MKKKFKRLDDPLLPFMSNQQEVTPLLPARTLAFPADRSMGELFIRNSFQPEEYAFWEKVGRAQGMIELAEGKELRLNVTPQASTDLSPFATFHPDAIQYLQLSGTRVANAGLEHLKHLTGLRVLWLYDTRISDAGLPLLQGLTGLRVLNLRSTLVSKGGINELQKVLTACEIRQPWA